MEEIREFNLLQDGSLTPVKEKKETLDASTNTDIGDLEISDESNEDDDFHDALETNALMYSSEENCLKTPENNNVPDNFVSEPVVDESSVTIPTTEDETTDDLETSDDLESFCCDKPDPASYTQTIQGKKQFIDKGPVILLALKMS